MDKLTRSAIERATQQARKLLDEDFSSQLEGTFDVMRSGIIAAEGGAHLSSRQKFQRGKIVAAIENKRATGSTAAEAVTEYIRDAAFTTLNRFAALKMLESRQLVQECITKGEQSGGYKEFCGMAPGLALLPDGAGYRLYMESLFDEFSTEIKVLFDRRDSASVLWPKRQTFEALLNVLNAADLSLVWAEDETIGWVYQFFNSGEERKGMRDSSPAPRNSRELAVRNQFFTPRYVVQFLVDNTLGRLWIEMEGQSSRLTNICNCITAARDEKLFHRECKDPRDLRILDPACGSGHFLLYCFDLLIEIYEEAWLRGERMPKSVVFGNRLNEDYLELDDLRRAIPKLIVEYNLYGVDIDARCAQIAAFSLWLRAQRAWRDYSVAAAHRPRIQKTHIVVAEPVPGDATMMNEFAGRLSPPLLSDLFKRMVHETRLAGELGVLLRVEDAVSAQLHLARGQFEKERQVTGYLPGMTPAETDSSFDLSGIDDDEFFHEAETRIIEALRTFAETATGAANWRRRLFASDAAQGIALIDVVRTSFDVVLMNPPFGEMTRGIQDYASRHYSEAKNDIYAAFVRRGVSLAAGASGYVGALTSRAFVTGRDHRHFRRWLISDDTGTLQLFLDLGGGVLDGAMVETAAYVVSTQPCANIIFIDGRSVAKGLLSQLITSGSQYKWPRERFTALPQADLLYHLEDDAISGLTDAASTFEPGIGRVTFGLTTKDDFRFVRLRWEIPDSRIGKQELWSPFAKGGEYSWFTGTTHLLVHQGKNGDELAAFAESRDGNIASTRRSSAYYFKPAVCFSRRSQKGFSARRLRPNACFSDKSAVIVPAEEGSPWLYAVPAVLASAEYQKLITAQSKFGSYEIGPVKTLPMPDGIVLEKIASWSRIYAYFDEVELSDETSETFAGLPPVSWTPSAGWANARDALTGGLRECGLTPDERVLHQIDGWVREKDTRYDFERARRSWAVGVAFGRFLKHPPEFTESVRLDAFEAPPARSSAMTSSNSKPVAILVDDRGHPNDIVTAVLEIVGDQDEEELRYWLRNEFFSLHIESYSRSRRYAPIYWQIGIPSRQYSIWIYYLGASQDDLFRVYAEYVNPKLAHEERRLEALRNEIGMDPNSAQRKALALQESLVEELRWLQNEVKKVAPIWRPHPDDGVLLNFAPLWRLATQNKRWQAELKTKWDELAAGEYDWAHLAMHLWPERVIRKCLDDRSIAIAHDLQEVFWSRDDSGKWKRKETLNISIDDLIRERTTEDVKAALKLLTETQGANGSKARPGGAPS